MRTELDDANNKYDKLVEFGEDLKAQVERKIEVTNNNNDNDNDNDNNNSNNNNKKEKA